MHKAIEQIYAQMGDTTRVLLVLSIILFAGFLVTRLTKKLHFPDVSGYILAGILIGPCCLCFVPEPMLARMGFISDIALAFIAFGVGRFFKKDVLKNTGIGVAVLTLFEALAAGILVALVLRFLFALPWTLAVLLGAIATATAPASTMMTIRQYGAKGKFIDTLLQVVALDDAVCLRIFSAAAAAVSAGGVKGLSAWAFARPIAYNVGALLLGALCGLLLSKLLSPKRSRDNRLILAVAMLLMLSGICAAFAVSPLLSCMVFGAVYVNVTKDEGLFEQINDFAPPITSMFFVVSGMSLSLPALGTAGAVGAVYMIVRIVGKYFGAYYGAAVTRQNQVVKRYLGLALIPQAGVAIGLAFLAKRILPEEMGDILLAIILSSSVLYELVGPWCAKKAIILSGSLPGCLKEHRKKQETGGQEETGSEGKSAAHNGTLHGTVL